jgi:hypothetical protein
MQREDWKLLEQQWPRLAEQNEPDVADVVERAMTCSDCPSPQADCRSCVVYHHS